MGKGEAMLTILLVVLAVMVMVIAFGLFVEGTAEDFPEQYFAGCFDCDRPSCEGCPLLVGE
jgi:hypothetical protein